MKWRCAVVNVPVVGSRRIIADRMGEIAIPGCRCVSIIKSVQNSAGLTNTRKNASYPLHVFPQSPPLISYVSYLDGVECLQEEHQLVPYCPSWPKLIWYLLLCLRCLTSGENASLKRKGIRYGIYGRVKHLEYLVKTDSLGLWSPTSKTSWGVSAPFRK